MNTWPGPENSWEGVDAYFTWANSPGMLVTLSLVVGVILLCIVVISPTQAFAHKLIPTDGSNTEINSALIIPDPVVSWAMYEELNKNPLYYTFDAKKGEKL